jgi:hypothetical protein
MSIPYIEVSPTEVYHCEEDVFWIVTKDEDGETARAMFYSLDDAKEYLNKVKGIPLEEIKIFTGEEESPPRPDHHPKCKWNYCRGGCFDLFAGLE